MSWGGDRIDLAALERGEQITFRDEDGMLLVARSLGDLKGDVTAWCDYIDRARSYLQEELDAMSDEEDQSWTCPACGGREHEYVHADYPAGGVGSYSRFEQEG